MNTGSTEGPLEVVQRVCVIDIAKTDLVACVRVPHDSDQGKRVQEIREFTTLEGRRQPGRAGTWPFGDLGAMPDGGERGLDGVGRAQVHPVLRGIAPTFHSSSRSGWWQ